MAENKRTTIYITASAQPAFSRMAKRYGITKAVSAGVYLLDQQTADDREKIVEQISPDEIVPEAAPKGMVPVSELYEQRKMRQIYEKAINDISNLEKLPPFVISRLEDLRKNLQEETEREKRFRKAKLVKTPKSVG